MKNLHESLRLLFDGDGAGGASGTPPAATPPTTTPATPPPSPSIPPSTPPPAASASTPPASNPTATPPAAQPPSTPTLFGADGKISGHPDTPPTTPPATDDAAITTFVDSVKVDLGEFQGKPVELNKDAVRAIAPAALKHKISNEAAGEIIKAYDAFERKQVEAYVEQQNKDIAAAQQKVRLELGNDLPQFLADTQKGARFLFGDELMGQLLTDPKYGNNVTFIKALASLGRMVKTDGGIGGNAQGAEKDLATRWIESSQPKQG